MKNQYFVCFVDYTDPQHPAGRKLAQLVAARNPEQAIDAFRRLHPGPAWDRVVDRVELAGVDMRTVSV